MKISEVLDVAVNHLNLTDGRDSTNHSEFTCDCIARVCNDFDVPVWPVFKFVSSLGCGSGMCEFEDVIYNKRQQARALWLTFAAHYARELEAVGQL